jgi:tRNA pseudouridine13 synthase
MTATWPRERSVAGNSCLIGNDSCLIKAVPEDFHVIELTGVAPEGAGEHLYLRLEKISLATRDVARWLADAYGVPEAAVGYAGMKDKHAVTEQWFSVHTPSGAEMLPARAGVRVCAAVRHRRKLRRGELAGNRFHLRLREVAGDDWPQRLAAIRDGGVPNYFGPQRFGGDNLAQARAWLGQRRRQRLGAFRTGLHLSVLRSFLFNEVLAERVRNHTWNRLVPGDVAVPLASSSEMECPAPTGPLWGRGRSPASVDALAMEQAALAPHRELCDGLEHAGLSQQRRSLVLKAADLSWQVLGCDLQLCFTLPPGGYATTLLGEVFELTPGTRRT